MKTVYKLLLLVVCQLSILNCSAQWTPQAPNISAGYYVPFIDAVNTNVCWGLAADPFSQTTAVQQFTRTINGGTSWASGAITNAANETPSSISAINKDTAWVAMWEVSGGQGKILRTGDGGATWTWQSTALFSATGNFPDIVHFWDGNTGVCMGDPTGGYFEIYTTSNGGTTWTRVPQGNIAANLAGEFGITDVCTAQGSTNIWFGTNMGRIYRSTDNGLNWSASQTPFTDFIGSIAFRDAMNGLAVSGGATGSADVAKTTDGGATWSLVGTNTAGMTLKQGLVYVPGTTSTYFISTPYAGSVNGTTFSPNDGVSWVPVDNLIHTDIDFVNDSTGWTGSNEAGAPMYKWSTHIVVPALDAASQSIDMSPNVGLTTQSPKATFVNNGLTTSSFDVTMTITGGYTSTKTVNSLAFFATSQVTFDPWTPAATGPYTVKIYTSLAGDTNHNNDTLSTGITVYEGFANEGWVSKPEFASGLSTFGLASAFYLEKTSSTSPGSIYSIGGSTFAASQPTMNRYATVPNTWGTAAAMPTAKYQFSARTAGAKIICSGGYSGGFVPDANTYIYDVILDSWSTGTAMPIPVGDYASGVLGDSLIYYIGGYDGALDQNIVQVYHVATDSWTTATSKPGEACAGLRGDISGNTIIIAGGYSQNLAATLSDAYKGVINPADASLITWTSIPAYPAGTVARLGAGRVFNDFIPEIIFAGGDATGAGGVTMSDCWGYDVAQDKWLVGTNKTTAVSNISDLVGIVTNDTLWMASVSGYDGVNLSSVHEWLNLGYFVWTGIDESNLASVSAVSIYPNPFNSEIKINCISSGEVFLFDVAGKQILHQTVSAGKSILNTESIAAGFYMLNINGKNFKMVKGN